MVDENYDEDADHDVGSGVAEDPGQSQAVRSMLDNSGIYTANTRSCVDDDTMFVCEIKTFKDLSNGLTQLCKCGYLCWKMTGFARQFGHVLRVEYTCQKCKSKKWWASSRICGGRYVVNQRFVHAFTCTGIIPTQVHYILWNWDCWQGIYQICIQVARIY
jgi:hypothetical protein